MRYIMNTNYQPNTLARAIKNFFSEYLPSLRGMSPNTIHSYRDSLVLLLRFMAEQKKCNVAKLDVDDFTTQKIIAFLEYLESKRHNCRATRNIRLAAVHAFFRFLSGFCPEKLELCQQILMLPFKRTIVRVVTYFEYEEIQAILAAVNRNTADGLRDYTLLVTMFNTGARVQEILDLKWSDLQLIKPYQVRLFGKGRKERICPLWEQTVKLLKELINTRNTNSDEKVFLNHCGEPLTRFGVRYLLHKYCELAKANIPTLGKKKLHPHSMRHSTAIYLLKSGVDIVTVSQWLGHSNINSTNIYATIDLEMKREAINKIAIQTTDIAMWKKDTTVLKWLENL